MPSCFSSDIKPDNCILVKKGTSHQAQSNEDDWSTNDAFWDDKAAFDDKEWNVVLVDFGFAKALKAADCMQMGGMRRSSVRDLVKRDIEKQASRMGSFESESATQSERSRSGRQMRKARSFARVPVRAMSALGTRAFAAPEVRNAREKSAADEALAESVSDYGLIADAYSIGATIKVLLTGVPADENEMEFMGSHDNPLLKVLTSIFSCGKKGGKRRKRYKWFDETPKAARDLVIKLTKPVYADRLTVPLARDEPWIKGGMNANDPIAELPIGDVPAGNDDPIKFLTCAHTF